MKTKTYRKIVRASAIYDILLIFPYAVPVLAAWNMAQLIQLHDTFSFSGIIPAFEPLHLLFVNFMGALVLVWSILRVRMPEPLFGLYDSFARALFSSLMLFYLIFHNATGALWLFFIPDVSWALVLCYGFYSQREVGDQIEIECAS